jgi:alkanesulfonate monooxygenase SsuD/methylene tetrahydromethanopterin reductase-like flavin-dependent oxidoreductase (luciferase family)
VWGVPQGPALERNRLYGIRLPTSVRLSAFSVLDAFPIGEAPARDRYGELLRLAEVSDRAGLSAIWVAEHHFHSGGVCPAPPVLLSAIGQRTSRIRLGVLVGVLPFHSPVAFAEEYALLDRLVDGRLNVGVGSGYIAREFEGFGVPPAEKRERFERALATILAAWRGEEVRVDSERSAAVRLNVRPLQEPHPPLRIAVQRREAIEHVARKGLGVALVPYATVANLDDLASEVAEFRSSLPPGSGADVAVAVPLYVGAETEQATEAFQRYLDSRLATQSTFYAEKVRTDPRNASARALLESGLAVIGTPEQADAVLTRIAATGVDELLGIFDFGGLPFETAATSVEAASRLSIFRDGASSR